MNRGLGPPRQTEPPPFDLLFFKELPDGPMVRDGPVGNHNLLVLFAYCLLREVEGLMARNRDVTINEERQVIIWRLPVSKTGPMAVGCEREWGCLCGDTLGP